MTDIRIFTKTDRELLGDALLIARTAQALAREIGVNRSSVRIWANGGSMHQISKLKLEAYIRQHTKA